jgi:Lrp/AsnC family leucine-responsive transcriptional regulator
MDKIDLKLLQNLCITPRSSINQIAKKSLISQQVADYRIKQMQQSGIITGFHTVINPLATGFRLFRIKIWFSKIDSTIKTKLLTDLKKQEGVAWAGFTNSTWDLIIDFYAKNSLDVESFMNKLISTYPSISRYNLFELSEVIEKNYGYISNVSDDLKIVLSDGDIDAIDHEILKSIRQNFRKKLVDIAKETKSSIPTIINKIKSLEKKKIIVGYRPFINPRKFDKESYKLIFYLQDQKPEDVTKIISLGLSNQLVTYIARYFGNNIIDFEVECSNKQELQEFIIFIRNKISVRELQIVFVLEDIELNHYPFN